MFPFPVDYKYLRLCRECWDKIHKSNAGSHRQEEAAERTVDMNKSRLRGIPRTIDPIVGQYGGDE